MSIKTVIHREYGDDQNVEVPSLTDSEVQALAYAFLDRPHVLQRFEDMAGKSGIISGWHDATDHYQAARNARLQEAMISLDRLGLVESYYEHGSGSKERIVSVEPGKEDGSGPWYWVYDTGWRYKLNTAGKEVHAAHRAFVYKCCDATVQLTCGCHEKTFCPVHGGGCHGTHD